MRVTTLDPMSLEDVTDLDSAPYVIEGEGEAALKIYFCSEENRQAYVEMEMHGSGDGEGNSAGLKRIFDGMADSAITGSIN